MFEFPAGNDVKTAPHLSEMLQEGEIPIGFNGETNRVWNLPETAVELTVSIRDGRAAIKISGRAERSRRRNKIDAFAKNMLNAFFSGGLFPGELRREFGRVDKRKLATRIAGLRAHRTFKMTSVRSSESGAPCANQSTSRKRRSASSVALTS